MNASWLDLLNGKSALVAALAILGISITYTNYAIQTRAPFLFAEKSITQAIKNNNDSIIDLKEVQEKTANTMVAIQILLEKHDVKIENLQDFQREHLREKLRRSNLQSKSTDIP